MWRLVNMEGRLDDVEGQSDKVGRQDVGEKKSLKKALGFNDSEAGRWDYYTHDETHFAFSGFFKVLG